MSAADVAAIAEEIKALTPPERLRLAADLLDNQRGDLAHMVAAPIIEELGAVLAIRAMNKRAAQVSGNATEQKGK